MNQTTNAATFGFRIIFRGYTDAGVYKRAVRTVQAASFEEAESIVAKQGEELAKSAFKSCGVRANRVHVALPIR